MKKKCVFFSLAVGLCGNVLVRAHAFFLAPSLQSACLFELFHGCPTRNTHANIIKKILNIMMADILHVWCEVNRCARTRMNAHSSFIHRLFQPRIYYQHQLTSKDSYLLFNFTKLFYNSIWLAVDGLYQLLILPLACNPIKLFSHLSDEEFIWRTASRREHICYRLSSCLTSLTCIPVDLVSEA